MEKIYSLTTIRDLLKTHLKAVEDLQAENNAHLLIMTDRILIIDV